MSEAVLADARPPECKKVSVKPLLLSIITPTPQHCRDDVSFQKYSHPEIRTSVQGARKIYIEEITSLEILSEHPQMQDESINTIQKIPNSQFRLVLSVMPCMPCISSLEFVDKSTSPLLFSSTSSPTYVPNPNPKDQLPPSPSLMSFHNTSSQHD